MQAHPTLFVRSWITFNAINPYFDRVSPRWCSGRVFTFLTEGPGFESLPSQVIKTGKRGANSRHICPNTFVSNSSTFASLVACLVPLCYMADSFLSTNNKRCHTANEFNTYEKLNFDKYHVARQSSQLFRPGHFFPIFPVNLWLVIRYQSWTQAVVE